MLSNIPKGVLEAVKAITTKSNEEFLEQKRQEAARLEELRAAKPHTVPKTAKEKSLAALAAPKDKITHADVMVGRGVKNEEVEALDELSKKTLGSYVKAAAKDAEEAGQAQEYHGHKMDYERGEKRQKGIGKAVDRLTKEEVENVEEADNLALRGLHTANPQSVPSYMRSTEKGKKSLADKNKSVLKDLIKRQLGRHPKANLPEEIELEEGSSKVWAVTGTWTHRKHQKDPITTTTRVNAKSPEEAMDKYKSHMSQKYERKVHKMKVKPHTNQASTAMRIEEVELDEAAVTHIVAKKDLQKHKDWMDSEGFDTNTKPLPKSHPKHSTHVGIVSKNSQESSYHEEGHASPIKEEVENIKEAGSPFDVLDKNKKKTYTSQMSSKPGEKAGFTSKKISTGTVYSRKPAKDMKEATDTPGNSAHQCAIHVKSEQFGEGKTLYSQHAEPDADGNIAWYDVMFEHGIEKQIPTEKLEILVSESHMNHKKTSSKKSSMKEEIQLSAEEIERIESILAEMDGKPVHPNALHVSHAGGGKYKVHAVGKNFSDGIKVGEHLSDSELDDFHEMGGKIKHIKTDQ